MLRRVLLAMMLVLPLGSCGLQPLYSGGSSSPTATFLRGVSVQAIPGQSGWLLRTRLVDRLGAPAGPTPYRLEVEIDDALSGFGIRGDAAITRERRTLRTRYRLVNAATGQVVLDATAGSDAGIDVVGSEYATVAAEQTALERLSEVVADQIVARLGLYAVRSGAK